MSNPKDAHIPLRVPVNHIPYLEKHKIYPLFMELSRELVVQQPDDHLLFLKQILLNAARGRNNARIILLGGDTCLKIASEIAKITKQALIKPEVLSQYFYSAERTLFDAEKLAKVLGILLKSEQAYKNGWIIADCIQNEKEAKLLIKHGILPTHVFHLIPEYQPDLNQLIYCNVQVNWPEYRRKLTGIRRVFQHTLHEVFLQKRAISEIVTEIIEICRLRTSITFVKPRVLLIGPRGSGRKTQARMLAENLNLVYIDFEYLLCQTWQYGGELGKRLKAPSGGQQSKLLAEIINRRILEADCVQNGWIMTNGFPFGGQDLKCLDYLVDTPPNRIIFLECDLNICKERIAAKMGAVTGKIHPRDGAEVVDAEHAFYCEKYGELRRYCGTGAYIVNGEQSDRAVYECLAAIVIRDANRSEIPQHQPEVDDFNDADEDGRFKSVCGCTSIIGHVVDCFVEKI